MRQTDKNVLIYVGLAFLALGLCVFFFGCQQASSQSQPQATSVYRAVSDIAIKQHSQAPKQPALVKEAPQPKEPLNQWHVFTLLMAICNDPKDDSPVVTSKCVNDTGACWLKLTPEKQGEATSLIGCAKEFFKSEGP